MSLAILDCPTRQYLCTFNLPSRRRGRKLTRHDDPIVIRSQHTRDTLARLLRIRHAQLATTLLKDNLRVITNLAATEVHVVVLYSPHISPNPPSTHTSDFPLLPSQDGTEEGEKRRGEKTYLHIMHKDTSAPRTTNTLTCVLWDIANLPFGIFATQVGDALAGAEAGCGELLPAFGHALELWFACLVSISHYSKNDEDVKVVGWQGGMVQLVEGKDLQYSHPHKWDHRDEQPSY